MDAPLGFIEYHRFVMAPTRAAKVPLIGGLATDAGTRADAAGTEETFGFVPEELVSQCRTLIGRYHAKHGYCYLPDILWHSDGRGFVERHQELAFTFKKGCKARDAKRGNDLVQFVATIVMALEALVRDVDGWGTRFPEAKLKAEKLLGAHPSLSHVCLLDTYAGLMRG